ncbi:response regulator [Alkalimarinus coralli]|uniref:response regulator n=1 Tax=Alkalimarinus coralli TaxID=2935863 RepID=UPI00202B1C7E|nr:response regulator [Alkalimarinus coralli]
MPENTSYSRPKARIVRVAYPLRATTCMIVLGIHLSLFFDVDNLLLWLFIISHTLVYPHLVYLFSTTRKHEQGVSLVDAALYGFCISLWSFNPLATTVFIGGTVMSSFASGGLKLLIRCLITLIAGAALGTVFVGVHYQETLPLAGTIVAAVGLIGYSLSLGVTVYKINTNLVKAQRKLSQQAEQMQETSELAYAVNAHLELDKIMDRVVQALSRLHPFEQVYITLLDDDQEHLSVIKSYGESLSPYEHAQFEGLTFSLTEDRNSIFVSPILENKPIYIKQVNADDVAKVGAPIDQRLYTVKPSESIIYFPLSVENKVIGGLGFVNYQTPLDINKEGIKRISNYLVQVGTAIRNSQLFEEAQRASDAALMAKQAAETSEAAKSHFLANMSHEIRTPMTAIIGYSESLRDDDLTADEKQHFVDTIIRSGKHLLTIINDILDLSKIEAHKLEVEHLVVPLVSLIRDLKAHISIKAEEKGLLFNISPIFPLPSFFVSDPTRVKQILFNLASNAVKFTRHGSVNILIRYEEESDTLYFEVKDTGIGLTPEQKKRVFEPFVQADSSTTRKYGGTGLGLYISKQLASLLNGELYVDSQPGLGSEFVLAIHPGNLSDATWFQNKIDLENEMRADEYAGEQIDKTKLEGKVLVAEDNLENQKLITHILKRMGVDITIVSNGIEALEKVAETEVDLILLDIQMPEMGGEEAAAQLKAQGCNIPIIALTANVMQHQLKRYRDIGFVNFIAKPFDRKYFYHVLKQYLPEKPYQLKGHVLIADDNPVNLKLLKRQVEKMSESIEVMAVEDGAQAIEQTSYHSFDLILLDMEMPIMGGIDALTTLRSGGNNAPVYMVTGNTSPEDVSYCTSMGATGHLAKPIDRQKLEQICSNHLRLN